MVITKGHFKGYRGFVKDENDGNVDVDLDAKLASFGRTTTRIPIGDVVIECVPHAHSLHLNKTFWQACGNASNASCIIESLGSYTPSGRLTSSHYTRTRRGDHTLDVVSKIG